MGFSTCQPIPAISSSSTFRAIRLLQLVCCLVATVSSACLMGWPAWSYPAAVALLLAAVYGLSWIGHLARTSLKSPFSLESNAKGQSFVSVNPWETGGATCTCALDAALCIFFTVSAALLLTNALAQREPTILGSMACHASVCAHSGSPNVYMVRGPPTSISSAWTALFVMLVANAHLFTVSWVMIAVWSVVGPSIGSATHTLIATGTPHHVSTLVATT